jgi:hypothetical protein
MDGTLLSMWIALAGFRAAHPKSAIICFKTKEENI